MNGAGQPLSMALLGGIAGHPVSKPGPSAAPPDGDVAGLVRLAAAAGAAMVSLPILSRASFDAKRSTAVGMRVEVPAMRPGVRVVERSQRGHGRGTAPG